MTSLALVLLTLGLLGCLTITGRLVAGVIDFRILRRFDVTGASASVILGTAAITVGFSWLSALGFTAPNAVAVLAGLHLGAVGLCWLRGTLGVIRPRGTWGGWMLAAALCGTATLIALLPVLRTGGYAVCNDSFHYLAFGEWLQRHGWGEGVPADAFAPATTLPYMFFQLHYPLRASYVVAMAQAALRWPALLVYPAVSALGILLDMAAVFVAGRWGLRLSQAWAGLGALLFAMVPHAMYWGHHNGFLQQMYGLAVLLLAASILSRTLRPRDWTGGAAIGLAILGAYLVLVYLAVVPHLVAAGAAWAWVALVSARRELRMSGWWRFVGGCAACIIIFASEDVLGLPARAVSHVSDVVGSHMGFNQLEFVAFASGTLLYGPPWRPGLAQTLREAHLWVTPAYVALALLGIMAAPRRRRAWPVAAVFASFVLLVAIFAIGVKDPWSGHAGHTWNLFKLAQYAYPLLCVLIALGTRWVVVRSRVALWLGVGALSLLLPSWVAIHWVAAAEYGMEMRQLVSAERPIAEAVRLHQRLQEMPPGTLYVVGRPAHRHPCLADLFTLLAYPRPVVGDWTGSVHVAPVTACSKDEADQRLVDMAGPSLMPIVVGDPLRASVDGSEVLGPGVTWIRAPGPFLAKIGTTGREDRRRVAGPLVWSGVSRLRMVAFTDHDGPAELILDLAPRAPRANGDHRFASVLTARGELDGPELRKAQANRHRATVDLDVPGEHLTIRVDLERGTTLIAFEGPPRSEETTPVGEPLLVLTGARVVPLQ